MAEIADPSKTYQGYANAATWAVLMAVNHNSPRYAAMRSLRPFNAIKAREFCERIFGSGAAPAPIVWAGRMSDVNWQQVADDFNGE